MQKNEAPHYIAHVEADLASLIPGFLVNRQKDLVDLESALAAKDFQKLQRIGHTLRGVAGSYGFDLIGEYGTEIERAAQLGEAPLIEQNLKKMLEFLQYVEVIYV